MIFKETSIHNAYLRYPEQKCDNRGYFARVWCKKKLKKYDLISKFVQCNNSFNKKKGTLRGMHSQKKPHEEVKLIQCLQGSIYDVIIDLRKDSVSYLKWFSAILSKKNSCLLYVPKGCYHSYQSLEDGTNILYHTSAFYHPESEQVIAWNDPKFNISWPLSISTISIKDNTQATPTTQCSVL